MSDDMWRRRREHGDETDEFGGPLFPDDEPSNSAQGPSEGDDTGERRLSFGPDTGPLPHWTEPPTGEVPRLEPSTAAGSEDDEDDVDVWSSFTTESPVWRDDATDPSGEQRRASDSDVDSTGQVYTDDLSTPIDSPRTGEQPVTTPPRREPGRITIGTDPSGVPRRPPPGTSRRRSAQQRSGRPAGPARTAAGGVGSGRNLPAAVIAGVVLAALFVVATLWRPAAVLALVTVILAIAAFEYFGKVTEKGYRPAVAPGLAACVAAPLAAYWAGNIALPLVVAFAFIAASVGFLGASGVESGPLPNMAVTSMGVVWIGLLGSFAALILGWSNQPGFENVGTDTLFLIVLGVVANDIGALLVGSAVGKTPLREWISPSKTVEGLIGGTFMTFLVLFVVGLTDRSDTWTTRDLLLLALIVSVFAPLGDLAESMFKRNLDVKDFGTVLSGHGGVLDRFDSFLFVLPVAYYVTYVLEPWTR